MRDYRRGSEDSCQSRLGSSSTGRRERDFSAWAPKSLVLIAAFVCTYATRQADPDLWGYLAYGRLFQAAGGAVTRDPFAYTSRGFDWVPFEYVSQLLLWLGYKMAGPVGLIVLKCAVGGVCLYFLYRAIRLGADEARIWVPVFALTASTVTRYFLFRPQLFTYALLAFFNWALLLWLLRRKSPLYLLPITMALWANLHGGFVAGLGVMCLVLLWHVFRNRNQCHNPLAGTTALFVALAASFGATLATPMGWHLWRYVAAELTHDTNRRYIAEWKPLTSAGDAWSAVAFTILVLILLSAGLAARWFRQRPAGLHPWQLVAGCVPILGLGFLSVRHVPVATLCVAPVVALLAQSVSAELSSRRALRNTWAVTASLACLPVCLILAYVATSPAPRIATAGKLLGKTHPCSVVMFLRNNELDGNIYVPLAWGSYVTWQLYPRVRVSMDGRNISLFPDWMVLENLKFYSANPGDADVDAPLRYETDFLMVPSDRPVLRRLFSDRRWREIFADGDAALFVRVDRQRESTLSGLGALRHAASNCPAFLE